MEKYRYQTTINLNICIDTPTVTMSDWLNVVSVQRRFSRIFRHDISLCCVAANHF